MYSLGSHYKQKESMNLEWNSIKPLLSGDVLNFISEWHYYRQCESTNDLLIERAKVSQNDGHLVITDHQTKGRGRSGKSWVANQNNLMFSISKSFSMNSGVFQDIGSCSLVVGLSICEAIKEFTQKDIKLKWPNDVFYENKKLSGVLIESQIKDDVITLVIGIGINIILDEQVSLTIDQPAVCVAKIIDGAVDINESKIQVLTGVLDRLIKNLNKFEEEGFACFSERWDSLSVCELGQKVFMRSAHDLESPLREAKYFGVNAKGEILLLVDNELAPYSSVEVKLNG